MQESLLRLFKGYFGAQTSDISKEALKYGILLTGSANQEVIDAAINDVKSGRVEYRTDSFGNVHGIIGKSSFDEEKLVENLNTFVSTILKLKPATVKGDFVKSIAISSTMGPGIKIAINSFDK